MIPGSVGSRNEETPGGSTPGVLNHHPETMTELIDHADCYRYRVEAAETPIAQEAVEDRDGNQAEAYAVRYRRWCASPWRPRDDARHRSHALVERLIADHLKRFVVSDRAKPDEEVDRFKGTEENN